MNGRFIVKFGEPSFWGREKHRNIFINNYSKVIIILIMMRNGA